MTTTAVAVDLVGTRPTLSLVAPGGDVTRRTAHQVTRPVELSDDRARVRFTIADRTGTTTIVCPATATIELEEPAP